MNRRSKDTRRNLLDSAVVLLGSNPGASFIEIANAAGIGRATLYRHFSTREELIRALSLEAIEATDQAANAVIYSAENATDALLKMLKAMIPLGDRYHFLANMPECTDAEVLTQMERQNLGLIQMIEQAQKEGGVTTEMPTDWIAAVFNNLVYTAWSMSNGSAYNHQQIEKLITTTLLKGVSP